MFIFNFQFAVDSGGVGFFGALDREVQAVSGGAPMQGKAATYCGTQNTEWLTCQAKQKGSYGEIFNA